jgi:DNA-directed RNA polymerase specialized sigma24 family protein
VNGSDGACTPMPAFLQDTTAAEDATQKTFLRAYQNLGRFVGGNFPGWLMRIARTY